MTLTDDMPKTARLKRGQVLRLKKPLPTTLEGWEYFMGLYDELIKVAKETFKHVKMAHIQYYG